MTDSTQAIAPPRDIATHPASYSRLLVLALLTASILMHTPAAPADDAAPKKTAPRPSLTQSTQSRETWAKRRQEILQAAEQVMGPFPTPATRIDLAVKVVSEERADGLRFRKVTFQSDPTDRVPAWILLPEQSRTDKRPALLCLHQTQRAGKDEPVGKSGAANMHYGVELARRGFIVLAPDYPSFGEHTYDFAAHPEYASGTMKAIWDNSRAVDLLTQMPEVDPARIGVIGHSLGGHNAIFTALFEPRLKAVVSSCGFTSFKTDDVPSWTGPNYMPRIATVYQNDAARLPFDFDELIAALAPRPFLAVAATRDNDFDVSGVKDTLESARPAYQLLGAPDALTGLYPVSPHDFPPAAREAACRFLETALAR
jgi:dienelactone hydrolase